MDPNANLAEQNDLLATDSRMERARRSELRRALSDWLARGGFAPDWKAYPIAAKAYREWERRAATFQDLWR